jgi:ArsR family transcriptional regulator
MISKYNGETAFAATLPEVPETIVKDTIVKDMVKVFNLLSDETRLRILLYLTQTSELHVRALCDILKQSQPAVSHHLALLRVAELIESRREGKHNYYRLLPHRFQELLDLVFASVPKDERRIRFEDYVLSYAPEEEPWKG